MTFFEYLEHYTKTPDITYMLAVTLFIMVAIHLITFLLTKATGGDYGLLIEKYYELILSITSMLFFIGMFFLVEHKYFAVSEEFYEIWNKYDDFLLLLALFISIFLINFVDTFIIPLKLLYREEKATLRMMAMIYMLLIFAYIKFIYKNDNYDSIIVYFIIMVVGRFVYFDASFTDFLNIMKNIFLEMPMLLLGLSTTAIVAWYGFSTEYLLKSNGVVLSLWIAHLILVLEIAVFHMVLRWFIHKPKSQTRRNKKQKDDAAADMYQEFSYENGINYVNRPYQGDSYNSNNSFETDYDEDYREYDNYEE